MKLFSPAQKDKINKCEALDLVLIIDRSGSMEGTERGIILGHQKIIDALKKTGKNVTLTTIFLMMILSLNVTANVSALMK